MRKRRVLGRTVTDLLDFDPCDYRVRPEAPEEVVILCYWHKRTTNATEEEIQVLREELWSDVVGFFINWRERHRKYHSKAHAFDQCAPEDILAERAIEDYMYALHLARYFATFRIEISP